MNKKWTLAALAIPVVAAGIAVMTPGRAADHIDSPGATADKAADITDVYTFVSPDTVNGAGHLVMIMDVTPTASSMSKFSDKVEYTFHAHALTGAAGLAVGPEMGFKCTADAAATQKMTCTSLGGSAMTVSADFNATGSCTAANDICLFAGLRSDPFFFDFAAFQGVLKTGDASSLNSGKSCATPDGGTNFFAGFNVLSIILEVNAAKAFASGDSAVGALPILTIAADTKRTGN